MVKLIQRIRNKRIPSLNIGYDKEGNSISIPYSARAAHLHVIGRTRSGKSRFLSDLILQDIKNGHGVFLLDPHGELYDYIIGWLTRNRLAPKLRRIHPINLGETRHTFCFNPLRIDHPEEAYGVADLVTEALSKVFGNKATDTPLIDATLNTICVILAERGLPLAAAEYFLSDQHREIRQRIIAGHPDPYYRDLGQELSSMLPREFRETVQSAERRVRKFIGRPRMRQIFSQTENTMSLRTVMERGDVLLFNLQSSKLVSRQQMRALGVMLTSSLVDTAFHRDPRSDPRPFFAYIDEVQNFVTDDIDDILSEASKYGLFLTLSHQYLDQLRRSGEHIYSAVMANTLLKALFAMPAKDAIEFVDDVFGTEIDPERIKETLRTPHVVGHRRIRLRSGSQTRTFGTAVTSTKGAGRTLTAGSADSQGTAHTRGSSDTISESSSEGIVDMSGASQTSSQNTTSASSESSSEDFDSGGNSIGTSEGTSASDGESSSESEGSFSSESVVSSVSHGRSQTESQSVTESSSKTQSRSVSMSVTGSLGNTESGSFGSTEGLNEALEPIIRWFSTQTWSLEEQRYILTQRLVRAEKRHAYFSAIGRGTIGIRTREMPNLPKLEIGEMKLVDELSNRSEWLIPVDEAVERAKLVNSDIADTRPDLSDPEDYFE